MVMPRSGYEKRRKLKLITAEGICFSTMVGSGETYLPAFVLALGLGEVSAGLITTIPIVAGACLQLIAPYMIARLRSYRRWIILCTTLQACSFFPLIWGALIGVINIALLFACATLYWAMGLATGPAWNAWMERIVPRTVRRKFFAHRTSYMQIALFASLLLSGLTLQYASNHHHAVTAFIILFGIAASARLLSSYLHFRISDSPWDEATYRIIPFSEMLNRVDRAKEMRLLLFILCMQAAVYTAAPFFTPYMLRHLKLTYAQFVLLLAAALLAKIVTLWLLGHYGRNMKAPRLLTVGSFGIIPLPLLWLFSENIYYLMGLQLLSGGIWAFFELGALLLTFETIPERERTSVLTVFNLGHAIAMVLGSLFGGLLLSVFASHTFVYGIIFLVSTLARVIVVVLLKWVGKVPLSPGPVQIRTLAVRPSQGSIDRPLIMTDELDNPAAE